MKQKTKLLLILLFVLLSLSAIMFIRSTAYTIKTVEYYMEYGDSCLVENNESKPIKVLPK